MENNTNEKMMNEQEKKEAQAANGLSLSEIRQVVSEQMKGYGKESGMSVTKLVSVLAGAIAGKKEEYEITFVKDDDTWYVDFPEWPWRRENLAMVCGADKMLDILSNYGTRVKLLVKPKQEAYDSENWKKMYAEGWKELKQQRSSLTGGAFYTTKGLPNFTRTNPITKKLEERTVWLCPVTLFVLGHYPKYIYGKVID